MASSGKKGKKSKGTVISLQSFLWTNDVPAGTTQVAKNIRNVDGDDSDDGGNMLTVVCQLPTAPRANRIFDDESIPHKSPFIAYVTNLPFDVKEDDIYEYFHTNNVKSVRLPREDGDTGRVRGYGYVEFESRDDLINSLGIRDPTIKGRRIRIDVSNDNEQHSRQRGGRKNYESASTNDDSNWRRDGNTKRDTYNFGAERNFSERSDENNSPGSWRRKNQSGFTISADQFHQKDHDEGHNDKNNTLERPKLVLKPRTLPLPELDVPLRTTTESKLNNINASKFTGAPTEKVFGSAKPVDTTARDLEMEERLADERRQDNLREEILKITNGVDQLGSVKEEKQINWRQQSGNPEARKNQDKRNLRTETRSDYVKESWKKSQDKIEGCDNQRAKDGKNKDLIKVKREVNVNRPAGKNICNQEESAVFANKYSGLEGDSD